MSEEPRATSRGSRLLQQDTSQASCASAEATRKLREVFETKEKLVNITQVSLLEFKKQSPAKVRSCVEVLLRLHRSILESPREEKFRKVKESGKVFSTNIAPFNAASDFLSTAGWRLKTIDFEAHWVCEAQPETQPWRVLKEAEAVLVDALAFLEQKAEKYLKEKATTKDREAAERERVRKAIKDDRQMHRFSHESRVLLPTPPSAERGSTRAGRGRNLPSPGLSSQQLSLSHDLEADDDDYDGLSDTQNESD